jgi:hypothetical protein
MDLAKLAKARKKAGMDIPSMTLGDFFFSGEDDLNPDVLRDED